MKYNYDFKNEYYDNLEYRISPKKQELKPGTVFCDKCEGHGMVDSQGTPIIASTKPLIFLCKKCNGTGILDWIEAIFGKTIVEEEDADEWG
jgi:DnaJ-class molecular chaperone